VRIASSAVKHLGIEIVEQIFLAAIRDIHAADRDRHDFGAAFLDRSLGLGEVAIFAGPDDQPRLEFLSA
jgi:hypothetical protein